MNNKQRHFLSGTLIFRRFIKALNQKSDSASKKENNNQEDKSGKSKSDNIKWTDKGMFWTTIVLTVGTLLLFWDATHQTDESKKSANAAIRADSLTEISFERDSIRYNKSLERDSIKNARSVYADSIKFQKQFALATKSLMDQAASIKETQEEFEKTHESYLIIPHIHMEEIVPNIDIHCFYALENLSTSPVEIIKFSFNTTAAPDFKDKFPDSVVRILDSIKDQPTMRNAYITEKYPFYDTSRFTLSPGYISGMNKHNWHIYALIQIVYRDLIFDKIRRYRAIVKMIPMGEHPTFNHFLLNENEDCSSCIVKSKKKRKN